MVKPPFPYVQPITLSNRVTITTTIKTLSVQNLGCLSKNIDNAQLYKKRSEPVCLPILPIVIQVSPQTVTILNEYNFLQTLSNLCLNHQDQIVCQVIDEEYWTVAHTYYGIIQKAICKPSDENIEKLIIASFDPAPEWQQQRALIKELLSIPPHKNVTIEGLVGLIAKAKGKTILWDAKKKLGYTSSTSTNTSATLPQNEELA